MRGLQRFAASLVVCVACFLAFPLSLGEGGALELAERRPADRAAAWRMDAEVRLFGAGADPDVDPLLVYVAGNSPRVYRWFVLMSFFAPGVLFFVGSSVAESVLRVFFGRLLDWHFAGTLPRWPLKKTDKKPSLVIGEVHHRTELREIPRPSWLRMPEKGLFTGLIIFGAIGTGKTTSCMRPFCRQLLEWQGDDPEKRVAALVLEVKGDFCYDVQEMLQEYGRMGDYMELSLPPEPGDDDYGKRDVWQWNPLYCPWVDTYSLAYSLGAIVNQLFGKSKEPFWQQAYTNVLQWIVAGYRLLPGGWFTFADLYACMQSPKTLQDLVDRVGVHVYSQYEYEVYVDADLPPEVVERLSRVTVTPADVKANLELVGKPVPGSDPPRVYGELGELFVLGPPGPDGARPARTHVFEWTRLPHGLVLRTGYAGYLVLCWEMNRPGAELDWMAHVVGSPPADELEQHKLVSDWHRDEWQHLDEKLRSSITQGMLVFLSVFVQPRVAKVFCPKNPGKMTDAERARLIPPLLETIESGKVLALNMPGGNEPGAGARRGGDAQVGVAVDAAAAAEGDEAEPEEVLPAGGVHLRRVPVVRDHGGGRPGGRREGVRADPAVALRPDRGDAEHLLAALGAGGGRVVAGAAADAALAHLPVDGRRREPGDGEQAAGAGQPDAGVVLAVGEHGPGGGVAVHRAHRGRLGLGGAVEVVCREARGAVPSAGHRAAGDLPGDRADLRWQRGARGHAGVPEAGLQAARSAVLALVRRDAARQGGVRGS